jgi:hypothetical protein
MILTDEAGMVSRVSREYEIIVFCWVWVERRTSNAKRSTSNVAWLLAGAAFFGGGNAGYEDPDELVGFVEKGCEHLGFRNELCSLDELQPTFGLAEFL